MRVWNKRDPNVPEGAVYVGRGRNSKYGNPHRMHDAGDDERLRVIREFRADCEAKRAVDPDAFERWIAPLRGRDLVCWCAPLPCHADVLLDLANAAARPEGGS